MTFPHRHIPLLTLLAGACLPLARILTDAAAVLPGRQAGDVYKHAWPFWHTLVQLGQGTWPRTAYLNAPDGGTLLDVMLLPSLIMAPVSWLVGAVVAANLWVLLSLLAVGWATYALCKDLTGSTTGSLCAGLVAQTSPFLLGYALTSGVHERLALWIFPLLLLGVMRLAAGASAWWILVLILGTAISAAGCPTYGLFSGMLLAVILPLALLKRRGTGRRSLGLLLGAGAGVSAALAGVYLLAAWFIQQPDYLASISTERVAVTWGVSPVSVHQPRAVATLSAMLNPLAVHATQPQRLDEELFKLVYIGLVPLLAMAAGLAVLWRRRAWATLGVSGLAGVAVILSLGPEVELAGGAVLNPLFYLASYLIPLLGALPPVWELAGVAVIFMLPAVAALIGSLANPRQRFAAAALLLLASLAERALVLPVPLILDPAPARPSAIYEKLPGNRYEKLPGNGGAGAAGALADIPALFADSQVVRGAMFMNQTGHGLPIPAAMNMGIGRLDDYAPVARGRSPDWRRAAACMRRNGVRWVAVHRSWFGQPDQAAACAQGLTEAGARLVAEAGDDLLFDLQPVQRLGGPADPECPSGPRRAAHRHPPGENDARQQDQDAQE